MDKPALVDFTLKGEETVILQKSAVQALVTNKMDSKIPLGDRQRMSYFIVGNLFESEVGISDLIVAMFGEVTQPVWEPDTHVLFRNRLNNVCIAKVVKHIPFRTKNYHLASVTLNNNKTEVIEFSSNERGIDLMEITKVAYAEYLQEMKDSIKKEKTDE